MSLEGKRVCIVSYAKYMEEKKFGKIIDSYDKVVRVNNGVNIPDKKHFGSKTDIFSANFFGGKNGVIIKTWNYLNKTNEKVTIFEVIQRLNIKDILINNKNSPSTEPIFRAKKSGLNVLVDPSINSRLPITTGMQAIIQLLYLKPKELMIIGFDFTMNLHKDYEEFYKMFRKAERVESRLNKTYDECPDIKHSTIFEKYLLKKLWQQYKLNVDPFLLKILKNFDITGLDDKVLEIANINKKFIDLYNNNVVNLIETGKVK